MAFWELPQHDCPTLCAVPERLHVTSSDAARAFLSFVSTSDSLQTSKGAASLTRCFLLRHCVGGQRVQRLAWCLIWYLNQQELRMIIGQKRR